jgi:tetratricopeptide (TPR) repeat protein
MRLPRPLDWLRSPASRTLAWERSFHAARLAHEDGKLQDAEAAYASALREAAGFESSDPRLFATLSSFAGLLRLQGRDAEAEPLCLRVLRLKEALYGPTHPDVAASLKDLVDIYRAQGKTAEARASYERALAILERAIGPDLPELAESLEKSGLGPAGAPSAGPAGTEGREKPPASNDPR